MPHTELFARLMSGEGEFWKRESGPKGDTYYSKQKTKLWKENSKLVDFSLEHALYIFPFLGSDFDTETRPNWSREG